MTGVGLRKAALYLASLDARDRRKLVDALPAEARAALRPLIAQVIANGWNCQELVGRALAEEIRGLTSQTSLSVDSLLALAKDLPADWTARVLAANSATDARFLVGLLDTTAAARVRAELDQVPQLPERLREALLAEAAATLRHAA